MNTTAVNQSGASGAGMSVREASMQRAMGVAIATGTGGAGRLASPKLRSLICPFCGGLTADTGRCKLCHARFDPLSRQASQNEMGPWFVRDESMPHRPGCNYSTIQRLVESGAIVANSVLRGPGTRQFWMLAKHTPGVAQLFGVCHSCGRAVEKDAFGCGSCQESFSSDRDRQHLGLGLARDLPGRQAVELVDVKAPPPAGAELVSGPAAIPLAAPETRRGSDGRRTTDSVEAPGGEAGLDAIKRIDELGRSVRALRRAWQTERQRSWIALGCAGLITAMALVIVLVT